VRVVSGGFIDLSNDMTDVLGRCRGFLGGFLMIHRIIHSPFGQVLKASGKMSRARHHWGIAPTTYKLIAFVLSAG